MTSDMINLLYFYAERMRHDRYAQRVGTGYIPVENGVSRLIIERHVKDSPIGLYVMRGDKTQVAILDFDSHDGITPWPEMVAVALRVIAAARLLGLDPHVYRSGGGRGLHLWFVWDNPQNARYVRHLLRTMLASVGMRDGTGGVAKNEVEVFPKQDRVEPGKYGNLIALPGARASVPLDVDTLEPIEWEVIDFPAIAQRYSKPVPELAPEEERPAAFIALEGDEEEVRAALKFVPADDYLTWLQMGLAVKHAFGADAGNLFDEWSATCADKYPGPEKTAKFWNGLKPDGRIGLGSVFHLARQRGWNGPGDRVIREMNALYGVFTHGRTTEIIIKEAEGGPEDIFIGKQPFFDRLAGEVIERRSPDGHVERVQKARAWIVHPRAAQYTRVVFDPSLPPGHNGRTWNLWRGFAIEPSPGDWSLLQDHILQNICRGDERMNGWLLNWLALGVQKPGLVIGTAPVLIGFPGTGKGVLAHAYGHLWGPHFIPVTHAEHVTGRFSGHLFAQRFVFVDEGMYGGNRKDAGTIKTRLTDPVIVLERKGVDAVRVPNKMIFMVASNEMLVVPADIGDRRWMVIEVGDARREDRQYFAAIQAQLEAGGYSAMLHDLLNRDLSRGPDPQKTIKTHALFAQVLLAQPPEVRYLHGILETGRLPQNWIAGPNATTIRAMVEELRQAYRDARRIDVVSLGRFISKALPKVGKYQGGVYFVKKVESGFLQERSMQYLFPPLEEARRAFSHFMNMPITWADVGEWQSDPDPREEAGDDDVL